MTRMMWVSGAVQTISHVASEQDIQSYYLCGQHRLVGEDQETLDRLIAKRAAIGKGAKS
jgi:hypothetical protein